MNFISYAQNFEDVILERFFKDKNDGFYVDVGAQDPLYFSLTKHFYDKGWRGINIEPVKYYFNLLEEVRSRDINLNVVVANHNGDVKFFEIPKTGISSMIKQNAVNAIGKFNDEKCMIESYQEIVVPSRTLESIFEDYAKNIPIDFLKIDAEGAEKEVILSNNWEEFRPKILVIEATKQNTPKASYDEWENLVISAEYSFVYFDGLNRFYLRNDLLAFRHIFSYPPCVFDEFVTFEQQKLGIQIAQIQAETQYLKQTLAAREQELSAKIDQSEILLREKEAQIAQIQAETQHLNQTLAAIYSSRGWRLLIFLYILKDKLIPRGSFRRKFARKVWKCIKPFVRFTWLCVKFLWWPVKAAKKVFYVVRITLKQILKDFLARFAFNTRSILHSMIKYVQTHPQVKKNIKSLLVHFPPLEVKLKNIRNSRKVDVKSQDTTTIVGHIEEAEQLSVRARKIYYELKAAIERNAGVH